MIAILLLVAGYLLICLLMIGFGLGLGYGLHWLEPDIEMGWSVFIGILTAAFSLRILSTFLSYFEQYEDDLLINDLMDSIDDKRTRGRRGKPRAAG